MKRNDVQNLAQIRIDEAEALIAAGLYSGAFYLAGYAVEFGLKACISKQTRQYDFPDKSRANESYSHSLKQLSKVAELNQQQIDAEEKTNPGFAANWGHTAGRWSEETRYQQWSEIETKQLFKAISDPTNGVLQWVKKHW